MQAETAGEPILRRFRTPLEGRSELARRTAPLGDGAFPRTSDFPTTRLEDWKFTNLAPLTRQTFQHMLSRVPTNWTQPRIENHLARYADFRNHAFVALNTAFLEGVNLVDVSGCGEVVEIPHHATRGISHPRNLIVVEEGAHASIIETYTGEGLHFTNAVTEIVCGENSIVDHYKLQIDSPDAFHISTIQVQQARNSVFTSRSLAFGAALARTEINAVLETGSECTLNGLYLSTARSTSIRAPPSTTPSPTPIPTSCTKAFFPAIPALSSTEKSSSARTPRRPTPSRPTRTWCCPKTRPSTPSRSLKFSPTTSAAPMAPPSASLTPNRFSTCNPAASATPTPAPC